MSNRFLKTHEQRDVVDTLTSKQERMLVGLMARVGKAAYREAKNRVGIAEETTLLQLSRRQASQLISELAELEHEP